MTQQNRWLLSGTAALAVLTGANTAYAQNTCTLVPDGSTLRLSGDCVTDEPITLEDGQTLDGQGYTITVKDPDGGRFRGPVISNAPATDNVSVTRVNLVGDFTSETGCDENAPLIGVGLHSANGSVTYTRVMGMHHGGADSGCADGYGILVSNGPLVRPGGCDPTLDANGCHGGTVNVEVANNVVANFQKIGVAIHGDVNADIHNNNIGRSAAATRLAASAIAVSFGAAADIVDNLLYGNQNGRPGSQAFGTAVLMLNAYRALIQDNLIVGNSDVGVFGFTEAADWTDRVEIRDNAVFDRGNDDHSPDGEFGVGLSQFVSSVNDAVVSGNDIQGFETRTFVEAAP